MSNLKMTAIEKLSGLTKSTDLKAALNDIQGEITAAKETIGALKKQMAAAPFEGGADKVASMRNELRDQQDYLELLQGLDAEGELRVAAMEKAERNDRLAAQIEQAQKDIPALHTAWKAFDKKLAAIRDSIEEIARLTRSLRQAKEAEKQGVSSVVSTLSFPDINLTSLFQHLDELKKKSPNARAATLKELSLKRTVRCWALESIMLDRNYGFGEVLMLEPRDFERLLAAGRVSDTDPATNEQDDAEASATFADRA